MSNLPPNKKIIAFDLDSTLAESKQKLRYDMTELILKLLEKTNVAIISGGSYHQFERQILTSFKEVAMILKNTASAQSADGAGNGGLPAAVSGLATSSTLAAPNAVPVLRRLILLPTNGSKRYDYDLTKAEWKMTHMVHFPSELKERVFQTFEQLMLVGDEYQLPTKTFGPALEDRVTEITFSALGQEAPVDHKRAWDPDQSKRRKIKEYLDAALPDANISIGGMTSLDIMPKGSNKATGLEHLLNTLGMEKDDMLYVGDALFPGGNDYSVLEAGIQTISVANPAETAKLIQSWLN